jgi:regulator of sirC expression with transglutaminase-like and TPR domain
MRRAARAVTALIVMPLLSNWAVADPPSRTWEFDLVAPGTYGIQVQHNIDGAVTLGTKVSYTITIGNETQTKTLDFIGNRMFVPLEMQIGRPEHVRILIAGLPEPTLQQTSIQILGRGPPVTASTPGNPPVGDRKELQAILAELKKPPTEIDLGRAKIAFDKLIDPSINVDATLGKLDAMASRIRLMPEFGPTGDDRVRALRRYLYEPNASNDFQAFQYDREDPLGHDIRNKLLSNYLVSRKGNCVTMPELFVILGQRLGIDVTTSSAPKHVLVKFNSQEFGRWINLEATSGANPARDEWLQQQFPSMTPAAIKSGLYLRPLTKREAAAALAETVAEYHFEQQQYEKAIAVASLILEYYPKDAGAMTLNGAAYARLIRARFMDKYPTSAQIPVSEQANFQYLSENNRMWFSRAEALGWREETKEEEDQYLRKVGNGRH